jgi:hypothetical protein
MKMPSWKSKARYRYRRRLRPEAESAISAQHDGATGCWRVIDRDGRVLAENLTNAAAWKWVEQHSEHDVHDEKTERIGRAIRRW